MASYSTTLLAKKIGIKPAMQLLLLDAPKEYRYWLGELPAGAALVSKPVRPLEAMHVFATEKTVLKKLLATYRKQIEPTGFIWVSWPKKTSQVATDITDNVIREVALPLGYVDIKVCAVSEVWSGLKLVIRKSERAA